MIAAIVIVFLVLSVAVLDAMPSRGAFRRAATERAHADLRFDLVTKGACFISLVIAIYALATYEVGG